jgi:hypothetical protein
MGEFLMATVDVSSALDNFERSTIFRFTRALAIAAVAAIAIALVVAGLIFAATLLPTSSAVGGREVAAAIRVRGSAPTETASETASEAVLSTVNLPLAVSKELSGSDNRKVLSGWLANLPKEERQDFVDNMRDVVVYAQQNNINTTDAINTYKTLKLDKVATTGFDRIERQIARATIIGGFLFGLALLAMFSLVLVLLAIERNTRGQSRWPTTEIKVQTANLLGLK